MYDWLTRHGPRTVRTDPEAMRKLYLMTSHTMQSYVLDVAQGNLPLCMGIVDDVRWPGFTNQ